MSQVWIPKAVLLLLKHTTSEMFGTGGELVSKSLGTKQRIPQA